MNWYPSGPNNGKQVPYYGSIAGSYMYATQLKVVMLALRV